MDFWIQNDTIIKTKNGLKNLIGRTNFTHILKQALKRLNVAWADECCPPEDRSPVAFNKATETLEYFDQDTKEWTEVPA